MSSPRRMVAPAAEWVSELRCSRCGAPLDATPDSPLTICRYCGYPNPVVGNTDPGNIYIVASELDEHSVRRAFYEKYVYRDPDLSLVRHSIEVVHIEGYYYPLWVAHVRGKATVTLMRTARIEEETREKKIVFIDRYEYMDGRMHTGVPGLDALFEHFLATKPGARRLASLSVEEWRREGIVLLGPDTSEEYAENGIKERIVHRVVKEAGYSVGDVDVEIKLVDRPFLVLLPVWIVYYRYRGTIYYAVIAGWSGERVHGVEPNTLPRMLFNGLAMIAYSLLIGLYAATMYFIPIIAFIPAMLYAGSFYLVLVSLLSIVLFNRFIAGIPVEATVTAFTISLSIGLRIMQILSFLASIGIISASTASLLAIALITGVPIVLSYMVPMLVAVTVIIYSGGILFLLLLKMIITGRRVFTETRVETRREKRRRRS